MLALQHKGLSAKLRVPQAHGPVRACRGQAPAVGAEVHAVDHIRVPLEPSAFDRVGLALDVPDDGLAAVVAGGQSPAIVAERESPGEIIRTFQKSDWFLFLGLLL